jgi:hypothetical protein
MIARPRIQWKHLETLPQLDLVLPAIPACSFFAAHPVAAPYWQGDLNPSKSLQAPACMRLSVNRPLAENN